MKSFIVKLLLFTLFALACSEVLIRIYKLTPDNPERYIDAHHIQRYKPGQRGYYSKTSGEWVVNDFGWLGTHDTQQDTIISIIGDSYIENMMNPISCNQGSLLQNKNTGYGYFEAGRSGITFIEAMEITRILEQEVHPKLQLIYVNASDFTESISDIARYTDRVQISLKDTTILPSELKSPMLKKVLYNFKFLYYAYLNAPALIGEENKVTTQPAKKDYTQYAAYFKELSAYCKTHYDLSKLVFVLHPDTDPAIIELVNNMKVKMILLDASKDPKPWVLGEHDGHWSCYGHEQVSNQVYEGLQRILHPSTDQ